MPKNLVDVSVSLLEAGLLLGMTIEVIRSFRIVRAAKRLEERRKGSREDRK